MRLQPLILLLAHFVFSRRTTQCIDQVFLNLALCEDDLLVWDPNIYGKLHDSTLVWFALNLDLTVQCLNQALRVAKALPDPRIARYLALPPRLLLQRLVPKRQEQIVLNVGSYSDARIFNRGPQLARIFIIPHACDYGAVRPVVFDCVLNNIIQDLRVQLLLYQKLYRHACNFSELAVELALFYNHTEWFQYVIYNVT